MGRDRKCKTVEAMLHATDASVEANGTKVKKPDKAIWLHIKKKRF